MPSFTPCFLSNVPATRSDLTAKATSTSKHTHCPSSRGAHPAHDDMDLAALRRGELVLPRHREVLPAALVAAQKRADHPTDGCARIELSRDELVTALYAIGGALAPMYTEARRQHDRSELRPDGFATLVRLMDPARRRNPKLEVRRGAPVAATQGSCVQIALCARTPQQRSMARERLEGLAGLTQLERALGGEVTLELAAPGVNKAVPYRYVQQYYEDILAAMHYKPGTVFDARSHRTVVLSDADGTLYSKQESCPDDPLGANLACAATRDPLLDYLRAGGVIGICTGNDLDRTRKRILKGIPQQEWPTLLSRIFISANGGASLAVLDAHGRLHGLAGYGAAVVGTQRQTALANMKRPCARTLDAVYLGDDARLNGNDIHGFRAAGVQRSVCVSNLATADLDDSLRPNHIPGETLGTAQFLSAVVQRLADPTYAGGPLFGTGSIHQLVEQARATRQTRAHDDQREPLDLVN